MADLLKNFASKSLNYFTDTIIPYFNDVYFATHSVIYHVHNQTHQFDFLVNFIFYTILILIAMIIFKVFFFIRKSLLKATENIILYLKKRRWNSKIIALSKEVEEKLVPLNKSLKFKSVFEFKDEPQKLEDILRQINYSKEKDLGNRPFPLEKTSGKVFNPEDKDLKTIAYHGALNFSYANMLHPDVFVSTRCIESELIKNLLSFFGGNHFDNCGTTVYTHTESIILTFLAYKQLTNKTDPEVLISEACPAVYYKVSQMMNIRLRFIPVDESGCIRIDNLKMLIKKHRKNAIMVVGFYPNMAFGNEDDIEAISELCLSEKIHLHVDANYGGFMAAFSRDKTLFKKFDLSLPGVSSLCANLSSMAKCPTGIVFIGYRNRDIRKNHYFLYGKWMGGMYASPTLPGSRVASIIVSAYITFLYLGLGSFKAFSKDQYDLINDLKNYISKNLKCLKVIGNPNYNVLSFTSEAPPVVSIYECLKQEMTWDLTIRFKHHNAPIKKAKKKGGNQSKVDLAKKENGDFNFDCALHVDTINLIITNNNIETVKDKFLKELTEAISLVESNPTKFKQSETTGLLRRISHLPVEYQSEALNPYLSSRFEFK